MCIQTHITTGNDRFFNYYKIKIDKSYYIFQVLGLILNVFSCS